MGIQITVFCDECKKVQGEGAYIVGVSVRPVKSFTDADYGTGLEEYLTTEPDVARRILCPTCLAAMDGKAVNALIGQMANVVKDFESDDETPNS